MTPTKWLLASVVGLIAAALLAERYLRPVTSAGAQQEQPAVTVRLQPDGITALGRLQPDNGVIRVAGPSQFAVVIRKLLIDDNDPVKAGQVIAVLDNYDVAAANVAQLQAELKLAEADWQRSQQLLKGAVVSKSEYESWQSKAEALRAQLRRAQAELELAQVRSPIDGQVLEVHAREGERVGPEGIAELGQTQRMFAVAEVYETDVGRVRRGQRATVTSAALPQPVQGTVDRVGLKIGKKDVLSVDPAAKTDARVVEVEILLDDSTQVAALTNLEVDVVINP